MVVEELKSVLKELIKQTNQKVLYYKYFIQNPTNPKVLIMQKNGPFVLTGLYPVRWHSPVVPNLGLWPLKKVAR